MDSPAEFIPLVLAAVAFVGGHFVLSGSRLRDRLVARLGENRFRAGFAVLALVTLILLIRAYGAAPYVWLWGNPDWARWLAVAGMPVALILVVGGLTPSNPTAAGAKADRFDPTHMGMLAVTRHPMMWGIGLFAILHLLANGDVASLILFGAVGGLALGGTLAIDAKTRRRAPALWDRLSTVTSNLPVAALAAGRARLSVRRLILPAVIGIALWGLLGHLHEWLFGVTPTP
jgi:uncharacterized membrane protein